ncbi:amidase signature domain-containing protein [Hysterangium stoloniferum]|nr:amidase signature domain-containing protein [Hysterangium stoloniferum]
MKREQILSRYQDWRLQGPVPPTINDVSPLAVSLLTEREREIVNSDATDLVMSLRASHYSAVEVTTAFCKVATVAQDLTNCLTEIFFEEALQRAGELDKHLAETGQPVGPLHGLPVSVKDHILLKDHDTSTGYIAWAFKTVAEKDAVAVHILRHAGAVFYVKTANPQSLLSLETNNNIWGRTLNPFNRSLTPGGSSGGEGALIALKGSPLGLGTDIGGSIRIPAVHTGLYGFKASVARIPHAGLLGSHDGMDAILGVLGPIARSARDLSLFCKVMLDARPWLLEPPLLEIPWKANVADGLELPPKLSFALVWDDGVVAPHPPLIQALNRVKRALIDAGHEVIDWVPLKHQEGWNLITQLYLLDAGKEYVDTLTAGGEPAVQQTQWILSQAKDEPYSVGEIFKLNLARERFRVDALMHWNQTESRTTTGRPVDAIISPVSPSLAPPHDTTISWTYTSHWNLLDYPAAVFPMGRYVADAEIVVPFGPPRNEAEVYLHNQWTEDPQRANGLPVGLQIIGRRHNEEKVLAMLQVVDNALKS